MESGDEDADDGGGICKIIHLGCVCFMTTYCTVVAYMTPGSVQSINPPELTRTDFLFWVGIRGVGGSLLDPMESPSELNNNN